MSPPSLYILSTLGMMAVAAATLILTRRHMGAAFKWLGIGAALWVVAVGIKVSLALLTNRAVFTFIREHLPDSCFVLCGGLWVGVQSSLCEIGLTLAAVRIWPQLGRDAPRAITIGAGAGAFEAALLGFGALAAAVVWMCGLQGGEKVATALQVTAASTPMFWLAPPVERAIAILCHAPSRALVLLGAASRKPAMILSGFVIFALVDGIAGAFHLAGKVGLISLWWIVLAILPFALAGVLLLRWCLRRWPPAGHTHEIPSTSLPH